MDVQMPEMDGFDATFAIRQLQAEQNRRAPIIALTAHASPADRKRCLAGGMDEYLAKPIRAAELYDIIELTTGRSTTLNQAGASARKKTGAVDWPVAFETVAGDTELLKELLRTFLGDRDELVNNLRGAILSGNAKEVRVTAHSLRGALNHLGARSAGRLVGNLEDLASTNPSLPGANDIFTETESAIDQAVAEMKRYLNS